MQPFSVPRVSISRIVEEWRLLSMPCFADFSRISFCCSKKARVAGP